MTLVTTESLLAERCVNVHVNTCHRSDDLTFVSFLAPVRSHPSTRHGGSKDFCNGPFHDKHQYEVFRTISPSRYPNQGICTKSLLVQVCISRVLDVLSSL